MGGGTNSSNGHFGFITDATKRATFVSSALELIEDYGLDGIDIDYEYPSTTAQGQGFADLVTSLRSALDSYASNKGDATPYIITVRYRSNRLRLHWKLLTNAKAAVSAKTYAQKYLNVPQMDRVSDIMTYIGTWVSERLRPITDFCFRL